MADVVIKTNRMRAHIEAAWAAIRAEGIPGDRRTVFTYMCGEALDVSLEPNDRFFRLIAPKVYNPYADKGRLPGLVARSGTQPYFPVTCFSTKQALQHSDVGLWFSKNRYGTAGKGMECVAASDLAGFTLAKHHVLQAGVEDIALYQGRKFTTRIYLLVWNGGVWLYADGFNVIHGVEYVPGSTDYSVQIQHEGYQKESSPVRLELFSVYDQAQQYWPDLHAATTALGPCLGALKAGSSRSEYLMIGLDCILLKSGGLKFLEINAIPNFMHTRSINERLNVPFIAACLRVMLGGSDPALERIG